MQSNHYKEIENVPQLRTNPQNNIELSPIQRTETTARAARWKEHASMLFRTVNVRITVQISFTETAVLLVPWPFGLHTLRSLSLDCPQTC